MSETQKSHAFEAFYRATDKQVTRIGGAGIGLTIVYNIMKAHGGKVSIDSIPGKGTSVSLVFVNETIGNS
jgi:two-component system phosphate regulon sensor histidine kinase PhoR